MPDKHVFVAPKDVGLTAQKLLLNPRALKKGMIENWSKYCENGLGKDISAPLGGPLADYVAAFDFSIFGYKSVVEVIAEHKTTQYHVTRFGSAFPPKPVATPAPDEPAKHEAVYVRKLLDAYGDKPLPPRHQRSTDLAAETHVPDRRGIGRCKLIIDPARCFDRDEIAHWASRQDRQRDGPIPLLPLSVGFSTAEMVVGYGPAAIGMALRADTRTPHRLEPSDMGIGECLARLGIMAKMKIDRISAGIGARDCVDGPVGLGHPEFRRGDRDGGVLWNRGRRVCHRACRGLRGPQAGLGRCGSGERPG